MELILGANSGLGRALAEELARRGKDLILGGRDQEELDKVQDHLILVYGIRCQVLAIDLSKSIDGKFMSTLGSLAPALKNLYIIAGLSQRIQSGSYTGSEISELVRVNFQGPVEVIESLSKQVEPRQKLGIVIASTVGVARPRGMGGLYCAAKTGLEFYAKSLEHAKPDNFQVSIIRYGYLDTSMSYGQKLRLPSVALEDAARKTVQVVETGCHLTYVPGWWRLILLFLKLIPKPLFLKLRS